MKFPATLTRGKAIDIAERIIRNRDQRIENSTRQAYDLANDQLMKLYERIPEDWRGSIERDVLWDDRAVDVVQSEEDLEKRS